jgi:hypothetical protein
MAKNDGEIKLIQVRIILRQATIDGKSGVGLIKELPMQWRNSGVATINDCKPY